MINKYVRGKTIIKNKLVFGGGQPKYHVLPKFVNWVNWSIFWLDTELVILRERK